MARDKDKHAAYMREWCAANRDKARANARASYQRNKAKRNAESKQWYEQNKGRAAELSAARYERNKQNPEWIAKRDERQRRYREANRDKVNAHRRQYMAANRDKQRAWTKKGRAKHGDKMNAASRQWFRENPDYVRERYAEDVQFKLRNVVSARFRAALKGNRKSGRSIDLLGCSIEEFRRHIEAQWQPGMTWENHRRYGWHIDHIRPLASFDLSDPDQQRQACHYTNLQPLWWRANISKRDRWAED